MRALSSMLIVVLLGALAGAIVTGHLSTNAAKAGGGTATGAPSGCPGDLNGDRRVDGADLSIILGNFGRSCDDVDDDGDGFTIAQGDCNDNNPFINPDAFEVCDGFDNNCNNQTDEGDLCPGLPNASGVCQNGSCTTFCDPGFANCNVNIFDGCETNTRTAVNHCGGCGIVCVPPLNMVASCVNGVCQYACAFGFADCNNSILVDGCEVNLFTNRQNCGACGNNCVLTPRATATACFSGECTITGCEAGWDDADGIYSNGCETPE